MNITNEITARLTIAGDTQANWESLADFKPLDRELILYKPDENCQYHRIKIGDGETLLSELPFTFLDSIITVDALPISNISANILYKLDNDLFYYQSGWRKVSITSYNELTDRPCYEAEEESIYIMDNAETFVDAETLTSNATSTCYLFKVSNRILDTYELLGAVATVYTVNHSLDFEDTIQQIKLDEYMLQNNTEDGYCFKLQHHTYVYMVSNPSAYAQAVNIPFIESGLYLSEYDLDAAHPQEITITQLSVFDKVLKCLDDKYLDISENSLLGKLIAQVNLLEQRINALT